MSLSLSLYRLAMGVLEPVAPALLKRRAARGKEDPKRMRERLGHASLPRPPGKLVWLHGVSVGETLSLLALIDRIRRERPDLEILVTSGTVTSAELMAKRLPEGVLHQYAPVDGPSAVRRFIDYWRPGAAIFAESELWPNLIRAAKAGEARLALVSARLTESSAKGWATRRGAARELFNQFDLVLPQDLESAQRFTGFGVAPGPLFNLKLTGAALPFDAAELDWLRTRTRDRKVVVAASTHPGEEALITAAVAPGPLLIIVPRHPARGAAIAAELEKAGRQVAVRSRGDSLTAGTDVYLTDTLGEMGLFIRLADLVVLGGSLVEDIGGHNPLEPARLSAPIVSGPYVFKNAALFEAMAAEEAVEIVQPAELAGAVEALLSDPARCKALAAAGAAFAEREAAAFEAGWERLAPMLPQ